jgi:hypothetical protein
MAKCDKCKGTVDHIKYNAEDRQWYCLDCRALELYEQRGMVKVFEPYDLEHGPLEVIPDTDPNKIPFFTEEGKRVADCDKLHIPNAAAE